MDWLGLVTFSASLFLLVLALIRGNTEGWSSTPIVAELAGAVVLFALFLIAELRQERPMFDLTLFRKPTFGGVSLAAFTLSASLFAMFLYITLYLQNILGYSPLQTGVRFIPVTGIGLVLAPLAGRAASRGSPRWFLGVGLALGLWLYAGYEQVSSVAHEVEDPQRNYPRALAWVVPLSMATYLLPTACALAALGDWEKWSTGYFSQAAYVWRTRS